ncbi:helix-turn-helix domain-containing protein (plasmid) [Polymorphobacter sp. PAMC 29334]|nr:helix-turn-helix domain-containing protein [Polymorphobacter sp. PAMC 29334]
MQDLTVIDDRRWHEADRRATALRPLVEAAHNSREEVQAAAARLGLSPRQVWTLLKRLRVGSGEVTAMVIAGSSGGRGVSRLSPESEAMIAKTITEHFLTAQRLRPSELVIEVRRQCGKLGVSAPSASTIRRRLTQLTLIERMARVEGGRDPSPVHGPARVAEHALDLVQIDHTKVDLILVDPIDRLPIGRHVTSGCPRTENPCAARRAAA